MGYKTNIDQRLYFVSEDTYFSVTSRFEVKLDDFQLSNIRDSSFFGPGLLRSASRYAQLDKQKTTLEQYRQLINQDKTLQEKISLLGTDGVEIVLEELSSPVFAHVRQPRLVLKHVVDRKVIRKLTELGKIIPDTSELLRIEKQLTGLLFLNDPKEQGNLADQEKKN